jgi:hypothetical protein
MVVQGGARLLPVSWWSVGAVEDRNDLLGAGRVVAFFFFFLFG